MNRIHYIYLIALLLLLGAAMPLHAQTIKGNIYGGAEMAQVDGDTNVQLNSGTIHQDVFGGGKGTVNDDNHTVIMSADVTGTANVTLNGTAFTFPDNGIDSQANHNIYGGGNLACIVGATKVTISKGLLPAGFFDGNASWTNWIAAVNEQTDNVVQGSVFGGGYGVNTRVTNTAAVLVNITDNDATKKAMIDVIGGGYNGCVLSNTDVTVDGFAEIYKVYGGGLGSYDGYDNAPTEKRSHANLAAFTKQETIGSVGEKKDDDGTSVTIHGGKIYDNIFGGGAGLRYKNTIRYLNVAEVFGKTNITIDAIDSWDNETHAFGNKVYGGGALGLVDNEILVDIKSGTFQGAELFAGSLGEEGHLDKAKVTASATIRTSANDSNPAGALQGYFKIYGGCDMAQLKGNTNVELQHGTFSGSIFGAGKGLPSEGSEEYLDYGKVIGNTSIVIDEPSLVLGQAEGLDANGDVADATKAIKIYGGGALGLVEGTIKPVTLKSGTLYGEVFGGSLGELGHPNKAKVSMPADAYLGVKSEASTDNIDGGGNPAALNAHITIYGGCDMALVEGDTKIDITHGTFEGKMFGGGKGVPSSFDTEGNDIYADHGKVQGETTIIYNNDGTFDGNVYGGGALGSVIPASTPSDGYTSEIYLKKGVLNGHVFGGGYGESTNINKAKLVGNTFITTREMDDPGDVLSGSMNHIYGGGDMAMVDGNTNIDFTRGRFNGEIFGGGHGIEEDPATAKGAEQYLDFGKVTGTANVLIDGGELGEPDNPELSDDENDARKIRIYGGGALGMVDTGINIVVKSGTHYGEIFGGSLGEYGHPEKAKVNGNSAVSTEANSKNDPLTGFIKFYGGCNQSQVTDSSSVVINHGTFAGAVFGGGKGVSGSEEYGNIGGNASVLIFAGNTKDADVYGGGALGNVYGDTDVDLAGGAVKDVYGGGLGDASTAALVYGNTLVTLNGSTETDATNNCKVYGSIFGCNNVNGTPKGHAKVHVLKTIQRDNQADEPFNKEGNVDSYHVAGVYGGGNKAAYQPWTQEEITALGTQDKYKYNKDEFAEVLIEYCYNSIAYVYGGGNAAPVPATDVKIYGADAIDHAFAGGNGYTEPGQPQNPGADVGYLGYTRDDEHKYGSGKASITVYGGTVHNVYGGSNTLGFIRESTNVSIAEAPDDYDYPCDLNVGNVFGGGNEADIDGNVVITLECTEGADIIYAGANNANVNGSVTLNLLSGTYDQVYGGNNTGGCVKGKIEVNIDETGCWPIMINELYACGNNAAYSVYGYVEDRDDPNYGKPIESGERKYVDPVLNIYSCTRINNIYGGGRGETATVYGNTHVNINTIKGKFAGMDDSDSEHAAVTPTYIVDEDGRNPNSDPYPIDDEVGLLGYVYGGGNAAAVYGNTEVKIGTEIVNKHMEGVNLEWKDYNNKEVSIRIVGDVYGGSKGVLGKPDAALVTGDTKVLVGYEE